MLLRRRATVITWWCGLDLFYIVLFRDDLPFGSWHDAFALGDDRQSLVLRGKPAEAEDQHDETRRPTRAMTMFLVDMMPFLVENSSMRSRESKLTARQKVQSDLELPCTRAWHRCA